MTTILVLVAIIIVIQLLQKFGIPFLAKNFMGTLKALGMKGPPATIHLQRSGAIAWKDGTAVRSLVQPLRREGFLDAGTYMIQEMNLAIWALVKPDDGMCAVAYDKHPSIGTWLDLVTYYEDGTTLTMSNIKNMPKLEDRPGHDKARVPGADAVTLYREMIAKRPKKPVKPMRPEEFQSRFETAYAEEMAWRDGRGGATEAEIRTVAEHGGRKLSAGEMQAARDAMAEQARRRQEPR